MLYALQQQVQALCCIHQWFYCTPCQITFLFCHEARSPSPELLLSCLVYLSRPGASLGRFSSPHYLAPRLPPRPPSIFPLQHVVLFLIWRGIFTDSACNFSWFASSLHCPVAPFVSELRCLIKISRYVPVAIALSTSAFATEQLLSSSYLTCAPSRNLSGMLELLSPPASTT